MTWHSCVKDATDPAQDALDGEFHSVSIRRLTASVDIECHFLGTYKILQVRLTAPPGVAAPEGAQAMALVLEVFARRGLIATGA